ncbi:Fibrinogen-like protein A [Holothuria leucospilota]|uniref:Fibrinogen-like protein A n=1 Tax=Holothuria leucospilota TaxID=206669 RepID=A0A9Q1BVK2_HOLLE|nr:Fibrinogen-like protein A [Holothuria leucospilota]
MALSNHRFIFLLVIAVCCFPVDSLSAEGTIQSPSDSAIEGQGFSFFFYQKPKYPRDCSKVRNSCSSSLSSGVYLIKPDGYEEPFEAYCDNEIGSGNWTVFQRRIDGITDFYRTWDEYKEGFGDLEQDFWLGNEKLHYITQQATYEYRVDYVHSSSSYYNKYTNFRVDDETNKYRLANTGTRTGSRGYSLHQIQNTPFSTPDEDNDGRSYDCAEGHRSGWWHGASFYTYSSSHCDYFRSGSTHVYCSYANPNGDYNSSNGENMFDHYYHYYNNCNQKYTELKIRKV